MVAELLGLACVTGVSKLEIANGAGTAHRAVEGGVEVVEFPLPAVITVDEGLNKERLPSLKGSWRRRRSRSRRGRRSSARRASR
jgi:electron transfer flavoprotein beta subunit